MFAKARELHLEGIVSKRKGNFYESGKSRNWLKTIGGRLCPNGKDETRDEGRTHLDATKTTMATHPITPEIRAKRNRRRRPRTARGGKQLLQEQKRQLVEDGDVSAS